MPRGWRGGCFWEAGAGGPASPLAVIGFSFPSPAHKGPIEAVGKLLRASSSSRRSSQLLKSHSSPAQARGSGAGIRRAKGKETAGAGSDGGGGPGPSPAWGQPWGPPGPSPGASAASFQPSIHPGGNAPVASPGSCPRSHSCPAAAARFPGEETKVPFCGVGRAAAVATSDLAAGQSPTPLPSCPRQPSGTPLAVPHPEHTGQELCQLRAGAVMPRGGGGDGAA